MIFILPCLQGVTEEEAEECGEDEDGAHKVSTSSPEHVTCHDGFLTSEYLV